MMRSYEERAKDFIKVLAVYCKGCKTKWDFLNAAAHFRQDYPRRKLIVSYGVSRIVFITSDYVIKVDYKHNGYKWAGDCASEYANYRKYDEDGYGYLFATCTRYRCLNRYFYIMPRVRGIGNCHKDFDAALDEDEYDYVYDHCCDLHGANYGWDFKTNKPVIIDYAPY